MEPLSLWQGEKYFKRTINQASNLYKVLNTCGLIETTLISSIAYKELFPFVPFILIALRNSISSTTSFLFLLPDGKQWRNLKLVFGLITLLLFFFLFPCYFPVIQV